jgi:hypothetical protein
VPPPLQPLSRHQLREAIADYAAGASITGVARRLGIGDKRLSRELVAAGVTLRRVGRPATKPPTPPPASINAEQKRLDQEMRAATLAQIARWDAIRAARQAEP